MEDAPIDKNQLIKYWVDSSDDDFETMIAMYDTKRYTWALFIGHLLVEKLLKAYYVKVNGTIPPFIHNLLRLAEKCQLNLNEDQRNFFATVTAFNINTRYDDYKMSFKKKCTKEFAFEQIGYLKLHRLWIKELIIQ
jgi:HEPN domain-containing protein